MANRLFPNGYSELFPSRLGILFGTTDSIDYNSEQRRSPIMKQLAIGLRDGLTGTAATHNHIVVYSDTTFITTHDDPVMFDIGDYFYIGNADDSKQCVGIVDSIVAEPIPGIGAVIVAFCGSASGIPIGSSITTVSASLQVKLNTTLGLIDAALAAQIAAIDANKDDISLQKDSLVVARANAVAIKSSYDSHAVAQEWSDLVIDIEARELLLIARLAEISSALGTDGSGDLFDQRYDWLNIVVNKQDGGRALRFGIEQLIDNITERKDYLQALHDDIDEFV